MEIAREASSGEAAGSTGGVTHGMVEPPSAPYEPHHLNPSSIENNPFSSPRTAHDARSLSNSEPPPTVFIPNVWSQHASYICDGGHHSFYTNWIKFASIFLMLTVEVCLLIKRTSPNLLGDGMNRAVNDMYITNALQLCLPLFYYGWGRSTAFSTGNIKEFTFKKVTCLIVPFIVAVLTVLPLTAYLGSCSFTNTHDGSEVSAWGSTTASLVMRQRFHSSDVASTSQRLGTLHRFYVQFLDTGIAVRTFGWLFCLLGLFVVSMGNFSFFTWYKHAYLRALWSSSVFGGHRKKTRKKRLGRKSRSLSKGEKGGEEAHLLLKGEAVRSELVTDDEIGVNREDIQTGERRQEGVQTHERSKAVEAGSANQAAPSVKTSGSEYARHIAVTLSGEAYHMGEKSEWLTMTSSLVLSAIYIAVLSIILALTFTMCVVMFIPYAWLTLVVYLSRRYRSWTSIGIVHLGCPTTSVMMAYLLNSAITGSRTSGVFMARADQPTLQILFSLLFGNVFFIQGFLDQLLETEMRFVEEGETGAPNTASTWVSHPTPGAYSPLPQPLISDDLTLIPTPIRFYNVILKPLFFIMSVIVIGTGTPGESTFTNSLSPATTWAYPMYIAPGWAVACVVVVWAWIQLIHSSGRAIERSLVITVIRPSNNLFGKYYWWRQTSTNNKPSTLLSIQFHAHYCAAVVYFLHPPIASSAMILFHLIGGLDIQNEMLRYVSGVSFVTMSVITVSVIAYIIIAISVKAVERILRQDTGKEVKGKSGSSQATTGVYLPVPSRPNQRSQATSSLMDPPI
eukprot:GHVN01096871.1.p1 GENE.GHVN01096871.1~~GHVN01096871.1.p1  ORF type:complete len:791 (-),score=124.96 GHVN01096871.1:1143-3515(-)